VVKRAIIESLFKDGIRHIEVDVSSSIKRNASSNSVVSCGFYPADVTVNSFVERCTHIKEAFQ
jgi:hypothetical protein